MTEQISHKLCVAPMMQYTDMHDRYLLRLISKKVFLYTEMIATGSLIFGKCYDQLEFNSEEHPVGVQLGGSDINDLVECSKKCEQYGYDEINLNVGCPSNRVQKGSFGDKKVVLETKRSFCGQKGRFGDKKVVFALGLLISGSQKLRWAY